MPRKPKDKRSEPEEKPESNDTDTWGEDQKVHEYYYDDAHGYEVYVPENDDDEPSVLPEN